MCTQIIGAARLFIMASGYLSPYCPCGTPHRSGDEPAPLAAVEMMNGTSVWVPKKLPSETVNAIIVPGVHNGVR